MTTYQAILFHRGESPEIADQDARGSLEIAESREIDAFLSHTITHGETDLHVSDPDLILIAPDYPRTGQLGQGIEGAFQTASVPLVCLADAADTQQAIRAHYTRTETLYLNRFDATFPPWGLQSATQLNALFDLVDAYHKLNAVGPLDIRTIIEQLRPPERATEQVEEAIPLPISSGRRTDVRYVARWIHQHLFDKPGALITPQRAAIRAGLTPDAFLARRDIFESARYTGLFATAYPDRYWTNSIDYIAAATDMDVAESEQPTCITCGRSTPKHAAEYIEAEHTTLQPAHYGCSRIEKHHRDPYLDRRVVRPEFDHYETLYDLF